MIHTHILAPLFAARNDGTDRYRPVVMCVRCRREFRSARAFERAVRTVKRYGMGPHHEMLLRRQFARDGYGQA